jgi:hypothetical protein
VARQAPTPALPSPPEPKAGLGPARQARPPHTIAGEELALQPPDDIADNPEHRYLTPWQLMSARISIGSKRPDASLQSHSSPISRLCRQPAVDDSRDSNTVHIMQTPLRLLETAFATEVALLEGAESTEKAILMEGTARWTR